VISNKGGVGKTHLSINMAYSLAKKGARVLLIDADLGNADVSNKLGIFPKCHLMDFLQNRKKMDELLFRTKYGFDLIASSYGEFKLANLYYAQKVKFINHFRKISQRYEFAIFDLGAGISRMVMDFALAADHTIIVTTPQDFISGYACTKAGFSRFKEIEERLEEKFPKYQPRWTFSPMLVINQASNLRQGFKLFDTLAKAANKKINSREGKFRIEPEYLGAIPYERVAVRAAEVKKKPLLLAAPRVKAARSIQHMSTRFFHPEATYDPKVKFKQPLARFAAILSQKN
jgi:flagellar biosynthesis protein FlhG